MFGSSGFLFRSNKLMYDHQTHSLWNQFTGRPVAGKLTGSGIRLNVLPLVITSWAEWLKGHPRDQSALVEDRASAGLHARKPYGKYFSSTALTFLAAVSDGRLRPKDYVFGLRITGAEKAWPLTAFKGGRVINDRWGWWISCLSATPQTVQSGRTDRAAGSSRRVRSRPAVAGEEVWKATEAALIGTGGRTLSRLPGHIAYWVRVERVSGKGAVIRKVDCRTRRKQAVSAGADYPRKPNGIRSE